MSTPWINSLTALIYANKKNFWHRKTLSLGAFRKVTLSCLWNLPSSHFMLIETFFNLHTHKDKKNLVTSMQIPAFRCLESWGRFAKFFLIALPARKSFYSRNSIIKFDFLLTFFYWYISRVNFNSIWEWKLFAKEMSLGENWTFLLGRKEILLGSVRKLGEESKKL